MSLPRSLNKIASIFPEIWKRLSAPRPLRLTVPRHYAYMRSLITDDSFDKLIGWRDLVRFGVDRSSRGFCQRNGAGKIETPRDDLGVAKRRAEGKLEERDCVTDVRPNGLISAPSRMAGKPNARFLSARLKWHWKTPVCIIAIIPISICTLHIHHT